MVSHVHVFLPDVAWLYIVFVSCVIAEKFLLPVSEQRAYPILLFGQ